MTTKYRRSKPFFRRNRKDGADDNPGLAARKKRERIMKMKKGIFILPSLVTLGSIFLSFYAIILAFKGQYMWAAVLILVAGIFDNVDGRIARLTRTTTRFGLELDSLADVISFGIAPALLAYLWALQDAGRVGWVSAFVYVACGALRLARFNVQSGSVDPKRFNGLPIPMAAAMVTTTILFCHKFEIAGTDHSLTIIIMNFLLAFLMVSGVKFHAFKDMTLVKQKPFSSTVAFVLLLALVAVAPLLVPFFLVLCYVASGPLLTGYLYLRTGKEAGKEADSSSEQIEEADPEVSSA